MLYREIITVCSEIHTKHINTLCGFWWGNVMERDHLGDPGVDGRIILRWIVRKMGSGIMD